MIEIKNLHKAFGQNQVLKGVDITVNKGDVVVVIGPSGSGKTTMLRCINFLERADEGTITVGDITVDAAKAKKKEIHEIRLRTAMVFQNYNLFANKTALGNVMEGLTQARGVSKEKAKEIALDALEKVGLKDKADYYPSQLSGGQQQRMGIARAVVLNPDVILFDEPTSALDPELMEVTGNELKLVSLDGHRMSIRKVALKEQYSDIKVIVPGKTLGEISKILNGDNDSEVQIFFSTNHIMFEFDDTIVLSRLIEGEYFRINQMLSSDYETKVTLNRRDFMDAIDRASILVRENDKKPLILNFTDEEMELKMHSAFGTMDARLAITKFGKDLMIGFNPKFLGDALRIIDDEEVTLYMMNPKSPCFIRDEEETYIYLILPVNFNAAAI